tara:strand:+ start:724 stop:1521 length:798 start_codon:yes stop_codon:yes gene_type:complete
MGAPVLVGAGIGAATSLAMGKDPLMGAAMGGLSGGAFGGAGSFGSGFGESGLFSLGGDIATNAVPSSLSSGAGLIGGTGTAPIGSAITPNIGSVVTPEFTPNVLVDSAYNAPISPTDSYGGDLGMMSNNQFTNLQGLPPLESQTMSGGGYDPRLGDAQMNAMYQSPDFTPIQGATMSGGGAEPGGSYMDQLSRTGTDMLSNIDTMDAATGAVQVYAQLSPEEKGFIDDRMNTLPKTMNTALAANQGNLLQVNTPPRRRKNQGLFA